MLLHVTTDPHSCSSRQRKIHTEVCARVQAAWSAARGICRKKTFVFTKYSSWLLPMKAVPEIPFISASLPPVTRQQPSVLAGAAGYDFHSNLLYGGVNCETPSYRLCIAGNFWHEFRTKQDSCILISDYNILFTHQKWFISVACSQDTFSPDFCKALEFRYFLQCSLTNSQWCTTTLLARKKKETGMTPWMCWKSNTPVWMYTTCTKSSVPIIFLGTTEITIYSWIN